LSLNDFKKVIMFSILSLIVRAVLSSTMIQATFLPQQQQ